jgi:hypothetical protein
MSPKDKEERKSLMRTSAKSVPSGKEKVGADFSETYKGKEGFGHT